MFISSSCHDGVLFYHFLNFTLRGLILDRGSNIYTCPYSLLDVDSLRRESRWLRFVTFSSLTEVCFRELDPIVFWVKPIISIFCHLLYFEGLFREDPVHNLYVQSGISNTDPIIYPFSVQYSRFYCSRTRSSGSLILLSVWHINPIFLIKVYLKERKYLWKNSLDIHQKFQLFTLHQTFFEEVLDVKGPR